MKPLSPEIYYLDDKLRENMPATAPCFLHELHGLTVIDIKGKDPDRTRVMTTLIHGNEPSGFIATYLWLKSGEIPATNVRIIICNPETAQHKPIFTRRYVGDCEDLNRYFGTKKQPDDKVQLRANQIKQLIEEVKPEAIIDLHNTSGLSPAFALSTNDNEDHLDLSGLFTDMVMYMSLNVGSLCEQEFGVPIVTIECGGADEILSHEVATEGLHDYFSLDCIFTHSQREPTWYYHPMRIELTGDASVSFANHKLFTTDITFIAEIEQFNSHPTPKGEFLGWYDDDDPIPLRALDDQGVDQIHNLLRVEAGRIYANCKMQMFMATTNQDIATNDCITYATFI